MTTPALTPDSLNSFLAENFAPWVRDLGIEITEVTDSFTVSRMPNTERLARVGGIVSGQALMSMADTTMVMATAGYFGAFHPVATTNFDCQFLRPGVGEWIVCRADIVRAGKSLAFVQAELVAEPSGHQIARAQATFYVA
ncbi:PaaI family thioesterase [Nioella nitratireducens]|uniref:PaaI family thioesterase n=1 Tax=Nioella nitratireducens TaxID=1287720 RepID=UPI0008FCE8EF|nr:PaaI family thioesterase [Nioella nitratireducens]